MIMHKYVLYTHGLQIILFSTESSCNDCHFSSTFEYELSYAVKY